MEERTAIAPMPEELLDIITEEPAKRTVGDVFQPSAPDGTERIPSGTRHGTLLSLAGAARYRGDSEQDILAQLMDTNRNHCDPPLPDEEVEELASDIAARYPPGKPPPRVTSSTNRVEMLDIDKGVVPFPVETLPGPFRKFVEDGADSLPAPRDYLGVPMLTIAGTAIGTRKSVEIKPGWKERPLIWSAVIGLTGTHKSPALGMALRPFTEKQIFFQAEFESELQQFLDEIETYEDSESGANKKPIKPWMSQVMTTDATQESLTEVLQQNPRGILFAQDELSGWTGAMNQYRAGRGNDKQNWLSYWSSQMVSVNRKSQDTPTIIENPFVAVTGCLPPDIVGELAHRHGHEDGFMNRILPSYPDSVQVRWTGKEVTDRTTRAYINAINRLWDLPGGPEVLTMDPDAKERFKSWYDQHHTAMEHPEFQTDLRGAYAKFDGYCARFSLIFQLIWHVCGDGRGDIIEEVNVGRAILLIDYFKSHISRTSSRLNASSTDTAAETALKWLQKHGGTAVVRDILTGRVAGCQNRADVERLFADLEARGYGSIEVDPRRKDTIRFTLNAASK
jgi:hypothetical protein